MLSQFEDIEEARFSNDLVSTLFESMDLADVVIQTKTKELTAHKLILSGNEKYSVLFFLCAVFLFITQNIYLLLSS